MIKDWFRTRWKKVLVHSLILSGFVVYAFFLADPLFDKLEVLEGKSQPSLISLSLPTNNIRYNLEQFSFNTYTYIIEVRGWAFIEGESTEDSRIYIVLQSAENTYVFETSTWQRPDVTAAHEVLNLNLDWSGFVSVIPLSKIKEGEYNVGLYIRKADREALQYTDRGLVKSRDVIEVTYP